MKKKLLFFAFVFMAECIDAQINSTVKRDFSVSGSFADEFFKCNTGDTVTIHAFKKKSDKYYFALTTNDFAKVVSFSDIPFEADEKQLKKLPNALSSDIEKFIYEKSKQIFAERKIRRKNDALNGKIYFVVSEDMKFYPEEGATGAVTKGDTIYILGFSSDFPSYKYALYSDKAVGIFTTIGKNIFESYFSQYLPSATETDVKIAIKQKEIEFKQRQEELKTQYKRTALAGKVKGIISSSLQTDNYGPSPYSIGDTVSVIGYSYKDLKSYYALYSNKGYGIYRSFSKPDYDFKNSKELKFDLLPSVDSPEVTAFLERQREIADSLFEEKLEKEVKKQNELKQELIEIYKRRSPIFITDVTWSSNSVGGIEVELEVINCSQQTIKYITFKGYFDNAVGDRCRNEIGGGTIWTGKGVGPIGPAPTTLDNFDERMEKCRGTYDFDNLAFYSNVAYSFTLSSVTIQYMNGKTITLSGQNLSNHVSYRNPL